MTQIKNYIDNNKTIIAMVKDSSEEKPYNKLGVVNQIALDCGLSVSFVRENWFN